MKTGTNGVFYALPVASGILFGSIGVFVRELSSAGFSNLTIIAQRSAFAAVMLASVLIVYDKKLFYIRLRDVPLVAAAGIGGMLMLNLAYNISVEELTLSFAAVLLSIFPIFVLILSAIFFGERITVKKVLCIITALAGCVLVSGLFENIGALGFSAKGVIIGTLAAVFYALYSIISKTAMKHGYSSLTVTFYCIVSVALAAAPFAGWREAADYAAENSAAHISFLAAHSLCTQALPYLLYTASLKRIDTGKASVLASCEAAAALVFGAMIYGEIPSLLNAGGMILTIAAICIICLPEKP